TPPAADPVTRRRHPCGGQPSPDLLPERPQLPLAARTPPQQVRQPPRPPLGQRASSLLQIGILSGCQLLACLFQPLLRQLFLFWVAATQQPRETASRGLPRVGCSSGDDRVTR